MEWMELPKSWDSVTLEQYNEINEAPEKNAGLFSLGAWVLSVLLDCETEEIEESLTAVELAQKFKQVKWVLDEPRGRLKEEIQLDGISYKLKPFKKTTFGEAIDAFKILEGERVIEKMAALFYRRWKLNEWGHFEYETRGYSEEQRAELFEGFNVGEVCEVVNAFKAFNSGIRERYAELFEEPEPEEEDDREPWHEEEDEPERETIEDKREKARAEARKKNGWMLLALDLAGNDPTRLDAVFKLPFAYVINILAIRHETK